ncbi:MAG: GNAT family protein [Pseudomonadota bacterium]|nr:GNAT family protein [Pseudomonadota bacterium]
MTRLNDYDQPIGDAVSEWSPRPLPPHATIEGRFCRLEPINAKRHGADLFAANTTAPDGRAWTYLFTEPFTRCEEFCVYLEKIEASRDPLFFAVVDSKTERAVAYLALMRIDPAHGVIEVGNINYSPLMQRTPAATEAQYLLMKLAFDTLGYRRFEWKCDSLNAPSRYAALRYGFTFEGIFRQAMVYKGRSRDTAWFSIIDSEWLAIKAAMETWLSPDNFEPDGSQCMSLVDIRQRLVSKVPAGLPTARQQINVLKGPCI